MGRPRKNPIIQEEQSSNVEQEKKTSYTLKTIERDENGLIKNLNYVFDENGFVNWKAMVPRKFLYVNPLKKDEIEKQYGKSIDLIDIINDNIEDKYLVITLSGLKYLLKLRGFNRIRYETVSARQDYAAVTCSIVFIGNYETEGKEIKFEDSACAHYENTSSFYQYYLIEAATNRAFCRCVRNFLNINIVSGDELGKNSGPAEEQTNQLNDRQEKLNTLQKELDKKGLSWEQLKEKLKKAQVENGTYKELDLDNCSGIEDFSNDIVFLLTSKLKSH